MSYSAPLVGRLKDLALLRTSWDHTIYCPPLQSEESSPALLSSEGSSLHSHGNGTYWRESHSYTCIVYKPLSLFKYPLFSEEKKNQKHQFLIPPLELKVLLVSSTRHFTVSGQTQRSCCSLHCCPSRISKQYSRPKSHLTCCVQTAGYEP